LIKEAGQAVDFHGGARYHRQSDAPQKESKGGGETHRA